MIVSDKVKLAVSKAINKAMAERHLATSKDLGRACFPDSPKEAETMRPNVYLWTHGRGVPGARYRAIVSQTLEVDFDALGLPPHRAPNKPRRPTVAEIVRIAADEAPRLAKLPKADGSHFSFTVRPDGTMQLNIAAVVEAKIGWRFVDLMRELAEHG